MKKVIVIVAAFLTVLAGKVSAQGYTLEDCMISSITLNEGYNRVIVKTGSGTLTFYKERDRFSNVIFTDAAGNATELRAGAATPTSNNSIPDACFSSADGSISVEFFGPTDLSGGGTYTVALLLPAVQSAREAARRTQ